MNKLLTAYEANGQSIVIPEPPEEIKAAAATVIAYFDKHRAHEWSYGGIRSNNEVKMLLNRALDCLRENNFHVGADQYYPMLSLKDAAKQTGVEQKQMVRWLNRRVSPIKDMDGGLCLGSWLCRRGESGRLTHVRLSPEVLAHIEKCKSTS